MVTVVHVGGTRFSVSKAVFFLTTALMIIASPSRAETVLGRWCDEMLPGNKDFVGVITIVVTDQGGTEARSEFADGSKLVWKLRETPGGIFEVEDSGSGDKYRIVPSTGQLQLLDSDGLIRIAKRLENVPQAGDCIQ